MVQLTGKEVSFNTYLLSIIFGSSSFCQFTSGRTYALFTLSYALPVIVLVSLKRPSITGFNQLLASVSFSINSFALTSSLIYSSLLLTDQFCLISSFCSDGFINSDYFLAIPISNSTVTFISHTFLPSILSSLLPQHQSPLNGSTRLLDLKLFILLTSRKPALIAAGDSQIESYVQMMPVIYYCFWKRRTGVVRGEVDVAQSDSRQTLWQRGRVGWSDGKSPFRRMRFWQVDRNFRGWRVAGGAMNLKVK